MIIYERTLGEFKNHVIMNQIGDILVNVLKMHHFGTGQSEQKAWNNSLHFMKDVLDDKTLFSDDCQVAIEYNIPQTSKRVDFMILGKDNNGKDNIVIIELKQWEKVSKVDDISNHSIMSDLRSNLPTTHPSYQAFSYKSLILNYCADVTPQSNNLHPCAYLHNMKDQYREVLEDTIYTEWVSEAPIFLKSDVLKLRKFISQYIKAKASDGKLLYKIDHGRIKPQKSLQDSIDSMLCGNEEFKMIDDQVVAYDMIMKAITNAQKDNKKHVLIIEGGPGTGKSVLAINVLANCITKLGINAAYITKNHTPRDCYAKLLSKGDARKEIDLKLAIRSPFFLGNARKNALDVGIFDEAHRLQKRPFRYPGSEMLDDAICASKVSIFFYDGDQRITANDRYEVDDIRAIARKYDAQIDVDSFVLTSQFRCNGSDGYLSFVDNLLGIRETANKVFDLDNYDIRVFDNPNQMRDELRKVNAINNKSRMVAGYCFDWNVKNGRGEWDIELEDGFKAKWNLFKNNAWAVNPNSFEEVGCIHTCQGMEFDYVGVIIGNDLVYKDEQVITNKNAISRDDKSSKIRNCDDVQATRLIKNTYKVLLTRGLKGCFIYCQDKNLSRHIKSLIKKPARE